MSNGYQQPIVYYVPTDGYSVAALVLGLLGFNVLAVIFGIVGLSRTADGRRSGRGMAIAGIVLGSLWFVGLVLLIVLFGGLFLAL